MIKVLSLVKPIVAIALIIGGACGLIFAGLGIASYFGAIDMGSEFAGIDPLYMVAGGIAIPVGAWFGWLRYKGLEAKALSKK